MNLEGEKRGYKVAMGQQKTDVGGDAKGEREGPNAAGMPLLGMNGAGAALAREMAAKQRVPPNKFARPRVQQLATAPPCLQ
jgi:hypothetical protein